MKVVLVDPALETSYACPSLGLMYIAAILEENSINVEIVEMRFLGNLWQDLERIISKKEPKIVGITSSSYNFRDAIKIASVAKKVNSQITTVVGGSHASLIPYEVIGEPMVDIVVVGEGEYTMLDLTKFFEQRRNFRKIKGILLKKNGIIRTPSRPLILDLDELPFPARHLVNMKKYRDLEETTTVLASRGCPFKCVFCASREMGGSKVRYRSIEKVIDEVEYITKEYGFNVISFTDDVFTFNKKRTIKFCKELNNRGIDVKWECSTRTDLLSKQLLALMKKAGCRAIFLGIESGCQEILDGAEKGITVEQTEKVVRWAKEAGIETRLSFMLGCPGDSLKTIEKTIRFARKLKNMGAHTINFNLLKAYPGTEIFNDPAKFDITFIDRDWGKRHGAPLIPTCETKLLSMQKRSYIAWIAGELERHWNISEI